MNENGRPMVAREGMVRVEDLVVPDAAKIRGEAGFLKAGHMNAVLREVVEKLWELAGG